MQFGCKQGGYNGHNERNGRFRPCFVDIMEVIDAVLRCGHLIEKPGRSFYFDGLSVLSFGG